VSYRGVHDYSSRTTTVGTGVTRDKCPPLARGTDCKNGHMNFWALARALMDRDRRRNITAGFTSIDRFLQNRAPIFCLCFDGIGARHPGMTHHTPNRFSKLVVGCGSGPEQDPRSRYIPTTMSSGNRRHTPIAIKELMITLQTKKGLKKKRVADLLDVDLRTVRRVTKLEAETGSVVQASGASSERAPTVAKWDGLRRASHISRSPWCIHTEKFSSISSHCWREHRTFFGASLRSC